MRANRLRSVRRSMNMTAEELAQAVTDSGHPVSESMIYQIERGEKKPSLDLAAAISRVVGKPIEFLFLEPECTKSAQNEASVRAS